MATPDAGAVLLVELDGPATEVEAELATVLEICSGATEIRTADDPAQRAAIWKGRKSAFAAVGRLAPAYIVQDGVVPALPCGGSRSHFRPIGGLGDTGRERLPAGDGNLHPLVLYNDAVPGEAERAEEVSGAILDACIEYGGSITGEHGVGLDKARSCRRCSPPTTWTPCSSSAARSTRRTCATPARSSPPPGCAGRSPATGARRWPVVGDRRAGQPEIF